MSLLTGSQTLSTFGDENAVHEKAQLIDYETRKMHFLPKCMWICMQHTEMTLLKAFA